VTRTPRTPDSPRRALQWALLATILALPAPAGAQDAPKPRKDWHVDVGVDLGCSGYYNNALPLHVGVRAVASWKWVGGEFRLALLPLEIHDSYAGGYEHDVRGDPFVVLGEGVRVIAIPEYWVTPYLVVLAQQVVGTRSGEPIHSLGPILGVLFQWDQPPGFYVEGGTTFVLAADTDDLSYDTRSAAVRYLWQWTMGLNLRF
jgi:hypothetical protein